MNRQNVVNESIDRFAKSHGFQKKSGAWYRTSEDLVFVVQAQKSQYRPSYYLNLAIGLLQLDQVEFPKEHKCQIRTRAGRVLPSGDKVLSELLDLDYPMADDERATYLGALLEAELWPIISACGSVPMLRVGEGKKFIDNSLVNGAAQALLKGH